MRYVNISDLRKHLKDYLEESSERICITHNGQPIAVIMSMADYQSTEAALALSSDSLRKQNFEKEYSAISGGDTENYTELDLEG